MLSAKAAEMFLQSELWR